MKKTKNKGLHIRLTEELAHEFKVVCTILKKSQNEVIEKFINDFIQKNKASV